MCVHAMFVLHLRARVCIVERRMHTYGLMAVWRGRMQLALL